MLFFFTIVLILIDMKKEEFPGGKDVKRRNPEGLGASGSVFDELVDIGRVIIMEGVL